MDHNDAMAKPINRAYSNYGVEAIALLGQLIRAGRLERKMTGQELASRMGVSRALIQRMEKGDPGCSIGAVFEAAAITGVSLFDADRARLSGHRAVAAERLVLMPKSAHKSKRAVKDDF